MYLEHCEVDYTPESTTPWNSSAWEHYGMDYTSSSTVPWFIHLEHCDVDYTLKVV